MEQRQPGDPEPPRTEPLQREQPLLQFLDDAPVALHSVDANGIILWANQAELDLLGYRREEYVGRHAADFHADPSGMQRIVQRLLAGETVQNYAARLVRKDGSIRHGLISSNGLWQAGQFLHSRTFTRDITDWTLSQEALREAHETLSALVHASPAPIVAARPDGTVTIWNQAAEKLFGWSAAEVLGEALPFAGPEQGLAHEQEVHRQRKDGASLHLRVSTVPVRTAGGRVTALLSVYQDVTRPKRAEQRLLSQYGVARILAEARSIAEAAPSVLRTLCESLGWVAGMLWQTPGPGQALRCEAQWAEPALAAGALASLSVDWSFEPGVGLPGRVWAALAPLWIADLRSESSGRAGSARQAGLGSAFAFPIQIAGTFFGVLEFFGAAAQPPDPDLLDMAAALGYQIGDFFERQRTQKNLVDREASYRALTETASDGIVAISGDSAILFANGAAGRMFGYTPQELLGADLTMLMPDYLRNVHKAGIERYQTTGKRHLSWQAVAVPGKHRDGHEIPLEISFAEYQQNDRRVFVGILRDVTERKHFDEKLRQTAKLESLGLLAGGIAHDFNNLLTGILGNASLALDMLPETHLAAGPLHDAIEASERAAHLTKQLLAYAGKGRFVIRPLDLSDMAREIIALVKSTIPKNVHVRLDLAERLPCIEGDATQLQQLLMNLVINGAEAIGEETAGTVLVTTGALEVDQHYIEQTFGQNEITPGHYVTLEVHDTGAGMDEATAAKIFDPFFTTKFTGRGLGLAAVLGIVRGHKGALKVYSTVGKGTTFKVLFPATDQAAPETRPAAPEHQFIGKGTVLVVDDDAIIRKVAKSILERFGYRVLLAENGREALEIFEQTRGEVALVVLDLTMPVMNGEEALRQMKLMQPDVPILLSSGYNEMEAIQRFAGKGLAGFIQKPYSSTVMASKLKEVFSKA